MQKYKRTDDGVMIPSQDGCWVLASDAEASLKTAQQSIFAYHPQWTVLDMCDTDCLACRRLTELINERAAGYSEGRQEMFDLCIEILEELPGESDKLHLIYRDEAIESVKRILGVTNEA